VQRICQKIDIEFYPPDINKLTQKWLKKHEKSLYYMLPKLQKSSQNAKNWQLNFQLFAYLSIQSKIISFESRFDFAYYFSVVFDIHLKSGPKPTIGTIMIHADSVIFYRNLRSPLQK